jgi:hypothetical protein
MSRAIPTKPPARPFQPTYTITTTRRVPGRATEPVQVDDAEAPVDAPEAVEAP